MENDIKEIGQPLSQSAFWMKLVGVLMIIYGVLVALSIVGIVIAWLPIWMGVLLFQSASSATQASQSGDKDTLLRSLAKLKTYFTIMGITTLIGLILGIIGFLMGGIGAMMQMQAGSGL
ncbi:MAG TPA: DUF5362 family protein [Gammaproteobacteria bacterium]|nr:DUF5362 family protein [Gammaproteobacteria bacterium]